MSDVRVVWIASTSPLSVVEAADASPVTARLVVGTSYTPAIDDAVLATFVRGTYYVLGGA